MHTPVHSVIRLLPRAYGAQVAQRWRLHRFRCFGLHLHPRQRRQRLRVVAVQLGVLCGAGWQGVSLQGAAHRPWLCNWGCRMPPGKGCEPASCSTGHGYATGLEKSNQGCSSDPPNLPAISARAAAAAWSAGSGRKARRRCTKPWALPEGCAVRGTASS